MKAAWAKRKAKADTLSRVVEEIQFGKPEEAAKVLQKAVDNRFYRETATAMNEALYGDQEPPAPEPTLERPELVNDIMSMSRSKDGKQRIDATLKSIELDGRYEGERIAEQSFARKSAEELRGMDEAIVCAFIAEVEMNAALHGGHLEPGSVFNVASFIVAKLVEALKRAGYSHTRRDNFNRVTESRQALGV
jgi:hypothetical protein